MYRRQCAYEIIPGYQERAATLCVQLAGILRQHGVEATVLVSEDGNATLQIVEEYAGVEMMRAARAVLESDSAYRAAMSVWAASFFPLVRDASPALLLQERQAA